MAERPLIQGADAVADVARYTFSTCERLDVLVRVQAVCWP